VVYRTEGWALNCWWRASPGWRYTTTVINAHAKQGGKCSLSIQCVPSMNVTRGIYRWRYTSNVQLLVCPLTTVIFPEYSRTYTWIPNPSLRTVQLRTGPQLQAALFDLIDEDRGGPLTTSRQDACAARSSHVFVFQPEDPRDGHLRACSWHQLRCSWRHVFVLLRRPARRWCPQHSVPHGNS